MDRAIERVNRGCHPCAALHQSPKAQIEQSSCPPPVAFGLPFAAHVIYRSRQLILVLWECVTTYTTSLLLENERHETLREVLLRLCIQMRPLRPLAIIRTNPAPGFKVLVNNQVLHQHRITLELGNAKNLNKNPVAEKAVQELQSELLHQDPCGGTTSHITLAIATAILNSRIRSRGLSSWEMWTQRDQLCNSQIPLKGRDIIANQHEQRILNHPHSEYSRAPLAQTRTSLLVEEVI